MVRKILITGVNLNRCPRLWSGIALASRIGKNQSSGRVDFSVGIL